MVVDPNAALSATSAWLMPALVAHKGNAANWGYVASLIRGGDHRLSPQQAQRDATAPIDDGAMGSSSGLLT